MEKEKIQFNTENDLNVAIVKEGRELLVNEDCCTCLNILLKNDGQILTSFMGSHNPYIVKQLEKAQKAYFKALKKALKNDFKHDDCGCDEHCHCHDEGHECHCGDNCTCDDENKCSDDCNCNQVKCNNPNCTCTPEKHCGCLEGKPCKCGEPKQPVKSRKKPTTKK